LTPRGGYGIIVLSVKQTQGENYGLQIF
jgi:hypothetical protein